MTYSVQNDRIGLHVQSEANTFSLFLGTPKKSEQASGRWRSALQNPDLSQHEVETLLRKNGKSRQPAFRWDRLLKDHGTANTNG